MRSLPLIAALSYLLGSIPFGYLLVRIFRGEDVRQSGSGNIGATNVARKSPLLGGLTLTLDALKGAAAVGLAYLICRRMGDQPIPYQAMSLAAFCAVLGHIFPVWLKFHGGKGVATGLGAFVAITPQAVLISAGIFVVIVFIFRYVSLGSVIAVGSLPVVAYAMNKTSNATWDLTLITMACLLIIVRHRENIRRLIDGRESRIGRNRA